jgi:hypothetical protein
MFHAASDQSSFACRTLAFVPSGGSATWRGTLTGRGCAIDRRVGSQIAAGHHGVINVADTRSRCTLAINIGTDSTGTQVQARSVRP